MNSTFAPIGLYIHVPFCASKCHYCDFYSLAGQNDEKMEEYTAAALAAILCGAKKFPRRADTLYFGGGTPTLLGAELLTRLIEGAGQSFGLGGAEITLEMNPTSAQGEQKQLFEVLLGAGVNRLSIGLQSAVEGELAFLGRRHTAQEAAETVKAAQSAGFSNISLDLMLGIPQQTRATVKNSIDFCADLGVTHISAYLLKIEEGTPFAKNNIAELCPDEDEQAELYLNAVEHLAAQGYKQYEVSSFAKDGKESRHNLKYWNLEEYLGIGPAAHSMMNGERFYYPRSLAGFMAKSGSVMLESDDTPADIAGLCGGAGADAEEYIMLRLRLAEGLPLAELHHRYPAVDCVALIEKAKPMAAAGLCSITKKAICLTAKGFLVSNAIIARLSQLC